LIKENQASGKLILDTLSLEKIDLKSDNLLICGDNLEVMRRLLEINSGKPFIDLIYIDPPFCSNRDHKPTNLLSGPGFTDKWEDGLKSYLPWLIEKLFLASRCLKDTGSIVVHLDGHAVHYVKVELDKIFGVDCFQNEIIWSYRTGGASKRRYGKKHDNLLWYSRDPKKYIYNCIKERIYYQKPFFNPKVDEQGRYYADIIPDDTWDIRAVLNISKERVGYPTQKPEELLSKIISALTVPGALVADFFVGSGTTCAVAQKLGRRWIGIDQSPHAVEVFADRMRCLDVTIHTDVEKNEKMR